MNDPRSIPILGDLKSQLNIAVKVLSRCFEHESLVLGGGTVLASRWAHRLSTDLDFFMEPSVFRSALSASGNAVETRLREFVHNGEIEALDIHPRTLGFEVEGTQVSLFTTHTITEGQPSQREVNTEIWLETTEEILAKKLFGRILNLGQFTLRDFYDLSVARLKDRTALENVVSKLTAHEKEEIIIELSHWRSSPNIKDAQKSSPLLNAAFGDIAANLWVCAESVFKGNDLHPVMLKYIEKDLPDR